MASETKKRLALAIIDFLSTSLKDGTLSSKDQESIEVAQSCIAESFGVDASDEAAVKEAIGGQNLLAVFGIYEKLRAKGSPGGAAPAKADAGASAAGAPSEQQKQQAEALKGQGNAAMGKKDYSAAIEAYSKALELVPANPIYLSNRAAAYSASHQHAKASVDAELAVSVDPAYTKAWSRLGLARYALGDARGSLEAYEKGIEHEGNGGSDAMKRGYETAKNKVDGEVASGSGDDVPQAGDGAPGADAGGTPDLAGLASMLGGAGAGGGRGGGGGGPDLASMMNNPMFANMAQKMMSNPSLMSNLMNNPQLRQMAENYGVGGGAGGSGGGRGGGGGGMPDLGSLMSDPAIAELAKSLGRGGGPGPGSGGGSGGSGFA